MPPSILQAIGHTPLVPWRQISSGLPNMIWAKCEHLNPGGSVKDRVARAIVDDARARGQLSRGDTLVEATAGKNCIGGPSRLCVLGLGRVWKRSKDDPYAVEGIGGSEVPELLDAEVINAAERLRDKESFDTARRLMCEEDLLLVGGATGTAVAAALRITQDSNIKGKSRGIAPRLLGSLCIMQLDEIDETIV